MSSHQACLTFDLNLMMGSSHGQLSAAVLMFTSTHHRQKRSYSRWNRTKGVGVVGLGGAGKGWHSEWNKGCVVVRTYYDGFIPNYPNLAWRTFWICKWGPQRNNRRPNTTQRRWLQEAASLMLHAAEYCFRNELGCQGIQHPDRPSIRMESIIKRAANNGRTQTSLFTQKESDIYDVNITASLPAGTDILRNKTSHCAFIWWASYGLWFETGFSRDGAKTDSAWKYCRLQTGGRTWGIGRPDTSFKCKTHMMLFQALCLVEASTAQKTFTSAFNVAWL